MRLSTLECDQEDRWWRAYGIRAHPGGWPIYMNIEITKNHEIMAKLVEWKRQHAEEKNRKLLFEWKKEKTARCAIHLSKHSLYTSEYTVYIQAAMYMYRLTLKWDITMKTRELKCQEQESYSLEYNLLCSRNILQYIDIISLFKNQRKQLANKKDKNNIALSWLCSVGLAFRTTLKKCSAL